MSNVQAKANKGKKSALLKGAVRAKDGRFLKLPEPNRTMTILKGL